MAIKLNRSKKHKGNAQKTTSSFNDQINQSFNHRNKLFNLAALAVVFIGLGTFAMVTYLNTEKKPDNNAAQSGSSCPASTLGSSTISNATIASTGNHKIWARIMVPDTTNNSFYLAINNDSCYNVGDSNSIPTNTWHWVDYENGNSSTKMTYNFASTTGHTIRMTGREAGVIVDRIILLDATDSCVPDNTRDIATNRNPGDNCQSAPSDTTPPTVSLTAPANGAVLRGNVTISATAADTNGTISRVEFYDGTTLLNTDTTAPYTYTWATTAANNGTRNITARAYDSAAPAANSATSTAVSIIIDNTPPTITLTSPTSGTVSGNVVYSVNASDNRGVTRVDFYRESTLLNSDFTSPFTYTWNTLTVANATYTVSAVAYDQAGSTTASSPVFVTVNNPTPDTQAPTVPANLRSTGATSSSISLAWDASTDNVGVANYRIYRNGTLLTSVVGTSYTDTGRAASTSYNYSVAAVDAVGNASAQTSQLNASTTAAPDTTAPTVSMSAPANGATVSGTITVSATATDTTGIARVEFFAGTTKIGESTTAASGSTYSISWNSTAVSNGSYALSARATDSSTAANVGTSNARTVTIANSTTPPADTTAPSAPSNLRGRSSKSSANSHVSLTWTASTDNIGVTGYKVFRDGTEIGQSSTTSYTDTTSLNGTSYSYYVTAYDAAGNNSSQSNTASVRGSKKGDTNADNIVNGADLSRVLSFWNSTSDPRSDLNSDGVTFSADLSIVLSGWGQ